MYDQNKIFDALSLYNKRHCFGLLIDNILDVICISRSTLYSWIKIYGNNLNDIKHIISDRAKNRIKKYIKISPEIKEFIISHVNMYPCFNIKKLLRKIYKTFDVNISRGYIYYILKTNNISNKKIQKNSYPHSSKKFKEETIKLKKKIDNLNNDYVSIDETGLYLGLCPNKGWTKKGKRCIVKSKFNRTNKFSYVLGISKDKIVGSQLIKKSFACRSGHQKI